MEKAQLNRNGRTITEKNFDVFRQLIQDVHLKTHGKPTIALSEKAANDLTQLIENEISRKITGKTLRAFTHAVLNNNFEDVNPKLYTLHCLAEFVITGDASVKIQVKDYPYWYDYEKKFFEVRKDLPWDNPNAEVNTTVPSQLAKSLVDDFHPAIVARTTQKELAHACLVGGFVAGMINSLLVILLPNMLSGYVGFDDQKLFQMVPLITIANLGGASVLGWLCGYIAGTAIDSSPTDRLTVKEIAFTAVSTLILIVFFKQLASRPLSEGGRLFGRIDFETVSWFLTAFVGITGLIKRLRVGFEYSIVQLTKQALLIVIKAMIPIMLIYFIFRFFVLPAGLSQTVWPSERIDIFKFNFPHPERILLVAIMSLNSVFCILLANKTYNSNRDI